MDFTGCGNTLNMQHPRVLQLMMDSLRYWVTEMHVDGFRFDLASALARELHDVDRLGAFFDILRQDPVLTRVKLIAEPWDLGEGGYQVGNFPARVGGVERQVPRHDARLLEGRRRADRRVRAPPHRLVRPVRKQRPPAVRQHQLRHRPRRLHAARPRLLQRQAQRGQRRGQSRRQRQQPVMELRRRRPDGRSRRSARCARARHATCSRRCCCRRACRCSSPATRSAARSGGNNNAYCQDNATSWVDWNSERGAHAPPRVRAPDAAAAARPSGLSPQHFFQGARAAGWSAEADIAWLKPDGTEMTDEEWNHDFARCLGVVPRRRCARTRSTRAATRSDDDDFPAAVQRASRRRSSSRCPTTAPPGWLVLVDTDRDDGLLPDGTFQPRGAYADCRALARAAAAGDARGMRHAHPMPFGAAVDDGARASGCGRRRARRSRCARLRRRRHPRIWSRRARVAGSRRGVAGHGAGTRYAFRVDERPVGPRPGVALQSGRRPRGERGRRSAGVSIGSRTAGAAGPGTRR